MIAMNLRSLFINSLPDVYLESNYVSLDIKVQDFDSKLIKKTTLDPDYHVQYKVILTEASQTCPDNGPLRNGYLGACTIGI